MVIFLCVFSFLILISLLIAYKTLLCPKTLSSVQCYWHDAGVVITWNLQPRTDAYQIRYRIKNDQNVEWNTLQDLERNSYSLPTINGILYQIEITAKNSFGSSFSAKTISGRSRAPAPENLIVSHNVNKSNVISLRWTELVNCNGYILKRTTCLESNIFTTVKQFDHSTITNFEDTSFIFGVKYYYMIVSLDKAGESSQSNPRSVFPRAAPPSNLTVSYDECAGMSVKLQWKPVLDCDGYVIRRETETFSRKEVPIKDIHNWTTTNTEDSSFIFGLTYYYVVVSLDRAGESDRSNIVCIYPRAPAPSDLVASYDENIPSFISLHWNPVPNCVGYIVKQLKKSVRGMVVLQTTSKVSSQTEMYDASFTFGMTYYYVVISVDRAGESKRSDQVKICPRAPPPKNLIVSYDQNNCTSITIQWRTVINCDGYIIQRSTTKPDDKLVPIKKLNSSSMTEFADTSFTFGVVYVYTVVSLDQAGESGRSTPIYVCPRVPAAKGFTVSFDGQADICIHLSWEPVKNCKFYIVRRAENTSTSSYPTITTVYSPLKTKVTDNTFTFGLVYHYIVISVDQAGESGQSKAVSIFPRVSPPRNVVVSFEREKDCFILLQWDPLIRAEGYIIKRTSDYSRESLMTVAKVNDSSITKIEDRCFRFGVTYYYIVMSLDQAGESERSTEVSICPRISPPENITTNTPKNVSGTIVIKWISVPDSKGYYIHRALINDINMDSLIGKCIVFFLESRLNRT